MAADQEVWGNMSASSSSPQSSLNAPRVIIPLHTRVERLEDLVEELRHQQLHQLRLRQQQLIDAMEVVVEDERDEAEE